MKNIEVNMGDIAVVKGEDNLTASGIGSCLVITLYDAKQRIGSLLILCYMPIVYQLRHVI